MRPIQALGLAGGLLFLGSCASLVGDFDVVGSDGGTSGAATCTPAIAEDCKTPIDDNCNGVVNENCVCKAGDAKPCYTGTSAVAELMGNCKPGAQACNADGNGYYACMGEVTPMPEDCSK